jgi:hypothetical protein
MKYCFDLDNTLCLTNNGDYENSKPHYERINIVNSLYKDGNIIYIDSARGSTTKIDWLDLTKKQLESWGLKYHFLRVGVKFDADLFIDDKGTSDFSFFNSYQNKK